MNRMLRYALGEPGAPVLVSVPVGSRPRYVAREGGKPCIWYEVPPATGRISWRLETVTTGQVTPAESSYIGSLMAGSSTLHVFGHRLQDPDAGEAARIQLIPGVPMESNPKE